MKQYSTLYRDKNMDEDGRDGEQMTLVQVICSMCGWTAALLIAVVCLTEIIDYRESIKLESGTYEELKARGKKSE